MYKIIIGIICIILILIVLYRYFSVKSFVQNNGECLQYNIYKIHQKESYDKIPSSQLLEWSFDAYNAPKIMYDYTIDIQNFVGVNNMIWAIKKTNNNINWEYYFYGLSKNGHTSLSKLYKYNPKLSIKQYYLNIHKKYFPAENIDIEKLDKHKNNLIIYSVDVCPKFFANGKVGNIDIYLDKKNNDTIITPYQCSCYSFSNEIKLKGTNHIYDIANDDQKKTMLTHLYKYINNPDNILCTTWNNINHITLIDKIYSNSISINYFGLDINTFIEFLKKHKYDSNFINRIQINKEKLKHLSFEFAEDYNKDTLEITKTTIYGSF